MNHTIDEERACIYETKNNASLTRCRINLYKQNTSAKYAVTCVYKYLLSRSFSYRKLRSSNWRALADL